jgi:hypothetical protein
MKKNLALCLIAALCSATVSATPATQAPAPAADLAQPSAGAAGPALAKPREALPNCGYICDSFGRCYRVCW